MPKTKIHLTELNEYLAELILKYNNPVEVNIRDFTFDGFISIDVKKTEVGFSKISLDFDLQGCECSGLNEHDNIGDYIGKTLYTSSVREFVEFLSDTGSSSNLLVNIEDGTWVISLISYS